MEKKGRGRKFEEVTGRGAERRECISRQAKYFSRLTRASKADASFPILEAFRVWLRNRRGLDGKAQRSNGNR